MANPSTASHVIPARLLAQFAVARPGARNPEDYRKWETIAYSKNCEPKARSVASCFEREFYRIARPDGTRDDTLEERMAQQAEGPFNALLSCFDSPLYVQSHKHANVIGRYVANMFCRSHQRRLASHRQQERVVAVATEIVDDPKQLRQLAAAFSFRLRSPFPIDCVREPSLESLRQIRPRVETPNISITSKHMKTIFRECCPAGRMVCCALQKVKNSF